MAIRLSIAQRLELVRFLNHNDYTDVYDFGTYEGGSAAELSTIFRDHGRKIRKLFTFDSFIGMPENNEGYDDWATGQMNAVKKTGAKNIADCITSIANDISQYLSEETELYIVPGFFEDSLTDSLVKEGDMKLASLINIDCDLYCSAKQALHFMFRNKLVGSGTLLYFDDWGSRLHATNGDGESRAWFEISEEFNVKSDLLHSIGGGDQIQTIFKVREIG